MATKTTLLSQNVGVISFSQGSTTEEIMSAVNAEIIKPDETGHGWTSHDENIAPLIRCYKALNKDGVTSKYVTMDWSSGTSIRICGYSEWNTDTHLGTGMCGMTTPEFDIDLVLTDRGNIYVYANPRWLAFCAKQFSSPVSFNAVQSGIGGIFEIARDNPDDTVAAGYPPFCYIATGVAAASQDVNHPTVLLPKSLSGTDNQAGELSTIFGKTDAATKLRLDAIVPDISNHFSGKDWALTPYVHGSNYEIRGRIFGLKIFTKNKLNFMDKVSVTCDDDFMYDAALAAKDYYIIPGGYQANGEYEVRFIIPA